MNRREMKKAMRQKFKFPAIRGRDTQEQTEKTPDTQKPDNRAQKEAVKRFLRKLLVFLLVLWAIFTFVFGIRQVSGEMMYPRLRDGDLLLYYRLEQNYQIGDVVTYKHNGVDREARIVAQGGDVVEVTKEGDLLVNGHIESEEIFYLTYPDYIQGVEYPYTVPEDSYFVLCDYRTEGYDSRSYGAVSQKDLDGKIITVLRRQGI